jgi:hypothetical protein
MHDKLPSTHVIFQKLYIIYLLKRRVTRTSTNTDIELWILWMCNIDHRSDRVGPAHLVAWWPDNYICDLSDILTDLNKLIFSEYRFCYVYMWI